MRILAEKKIEKYYKMKKNGKENVGTTSASYILPLLLKIFV